MKAEQLELKKNQRVCEVMRRENAEYITLDTARYIKLLEEWSQETGIRDDYIREDREKVCAPFRRLFARVLDYAIYSVLWLLSVFGLHRLTSFSSESFSVLVLMGILGIGSWILALLFETFFLHWFGTTPGKYLLGLSVTYDLGGRIPKDLAWYRTRHAVFMVNEEYPVRHQEWYRMKEMYEQAEEGEPLLWDYMANTSLVLKDRAMWRNVAYGIVLVVILVVIVCFCKDAGAFFELYAPKIDMSGITIHNYK